MKSQPLIIVGIDGLEPSLVLRWKSELKNFARIIDQEMDFPLKSVFPPDSIPAWASIYTGKNPAKHGVLQYMNYLSAKEVKIDLTTLIGKTFWDMVGQAGKRVCVVNPFMAYPAWKVNGVMLSGPVFIKGPMLSYPPEIIDSCSSLPILGGIDDFPAKNQLHDFIKKTAENIRLLKTTTLQLFAKEEYDLRFITFLELDRIQHFLWRYHDEQDPTYPGETPYREAIKDFYRLFDIVVGEFYELAQERGAALMVLSDHGHGRRCTNVLNINELLRRAGYLDSKGGRNNLNPLVLTEKLKTGLLEFVYKHDLEDLLYKITPYIPYRKELKKSSFLINTSRNLAAADPDFGGTNPSGGIRINTKLVQEQNSDYEEIRSKIISELERVGELKEIGANLFKWIKRREEIYTGDKLDLYPDILFELDSEYGANWALHGKLTGVSTTHKKLSGGHKREGALYMANIRRSVSCAHPSLLQIAPTILDVLNVEADNGFEEESILV